MTLLGEVEVQIASQWLQEPRQSKVHDCGDFALIRLSDGACVEWQVCDVAHLQRLVVSTDAGAWGGDHARRRSVELQVGPSSLCARANHVLLMLSTVR